MIKGAKHLNAQDSIQEKKEQQKYGHAPDLLPRSPERKWFLSGWEEKKLTIHAFHSKARHFHLLENVGYPSARQLKSEVNSEGSDHYEGPGYA